MRHVTASGAPSKMMVVAFLACTMSLFFGVPTASFSRPRRLLGSDSSARRTASPCTSTWLGASASTDSSPPSSTSSSSSSSSDGGTASRQKRVSKLHDWSRQETVGIQVAPNAIAIKESNSGGLGLVATKSIEAGSVVVTVPASVALSVELPRGGPDDADVDRGLVRDRSVFRTLPWYVQFALYLYKLDKVSSTKQNVDMRPWLDSLPRQFSTPIHWDAEDRSGWLQYAHMVESVERQETSWKSHFDTLRGCTTPSASGMTWTDFVWGCECARSRAFSGGYSGSPFNPLTYIFTLLLVTAYVGLNLGTLEQAANGAALVVCASILRDFVVPKFFKTRKYVICPIIDMCNHQSRMGRTTASVAYEFFANAYSLATVSVVPTNTEVFISYGSRSNDQLLQFYGFVEADNPHDTYVMPPLREWDIAALEETVGSGPFAPGRLQKLDRAGLLGRSLSEVKASLASSSVGDEADADGTTSEGNPRGGVVLSRAVGIDPAVIQALRALVSTDQEWQEAGESIGNFAAQVSADNERKARLAARTAIESELFAKTTTLEEDRAMLKRLESNKKAGAQEMEERIALEFRIEKKKLLKETIERLR